MKMVTVGAKVGRSALVDRIVLSDFLDRVAESDDPEAVMFRPAEACPARHRGGNYATCFRSIAMSRPWRQCLANITARPGELVIS